jgi:hypothetical protein
MPEGPLGFDRRLASPILVLHLEFSKDVPVGRSDGFTNEFLRKLRNERVIYNRSTNIEVDIRELDPDEVEVRGLTRTEKVGTLKIEFTKPSAVEINDLTTLLDNINSIVFQTMESRAIDTNKLVGTEGHIRAKINGPAGGPRPFIDSELVMEGLYIKELSRQSGIDIEEKFLSKSDELRVDARVDKNVLLVNLRQEELKKSKLRSYKALFRDIGREQGTDLETLSIMPDGSRF